MKNEYSTLKILAGIYFLIFMIGFITAPIGNEDLEKKIAKEYNLPLSQVKNLIGYNIDDDLKLLPIPHASWHITTEAGDDIEVATSYFGLCVNLKKDVLGEYFLFDEFESIYEDHYKN